MASTSVAGVCLMVSMKPKDWDPVKKWVWKFLGFQFLRENGKRLTQHKMGYITWKYEHGKDR